MKRITKILSLSLVLSLMLLMSCSKDKDKDNGPSGSHKVVFKAIASPGSSITTAVYATGGGKTESFTSLSGESWTSTEYTFDSKSLVVSFGANGTGKDANSTLVVEIWVDGVKKADGKSTGTILSSSASYTF